MAFWKAQCYCLIENILGGRLFGGFLQYLRLQLMMDQIGNSSNENKLRDLRVNRRLNQFNLLIDQMWRIKERKEFQMTPGFLACSTEGVVVQFTEDRGYRRKDSFDSLDWKKEMISQVLETFSQKFLRDVKQAVG